MEQSGGVLFAFAGSRTRGDRVAAQSEWPLSPCKERAFEEGEHKDRPLSDVNRRDVSVVHSLAAGGGASPSDRLCCCARTVTVLDTAKLLGEAIVRSHAGL